MSGPLGSAVTLSDLQSDYIRLAMEHATALEQGDHRLANRCFDHLRKLRREFTRRGPAGEKALVDLLESESLAVRVWAATHALEFAGSAAESVLARAADGPASPLRLSAEMMLREWRARERSEP